MNHCLNTLGFLVLAILASAVGSCSHRAYIEQKKEKLLAEYKALPDYEALPIRTISWQQAREMMMSENVEYRQAQSNLRQAVTRAKSLWRDMIPSANIGYYYNRAIFSNEYTMLNKWGSFNTNVMFMLPEFSKLPVEYYTRALAVRKAEIDVKLKERELTAKLYQLFREKELEQKEKQDSEGLLPSKNNAAMTQEKEALASREQWGKLCVLLGNDKARWNLLPGDLPRVSPEAYGKLIELPSEENQLLLTMQVEAARLAQLGILIQYWPNIHLNFYSPTLFSTSGGNLTGFMEGAKDTRLNLSVYLSLDTQGAKANNYNEAKETHHQTILQARQKMREYKEKAAMLLRSWEQYREWNTAMAGYLDFRRKQGACHPDDVRSQHEESQSILSEIREQERKNLERECALIQEYGLPNEATPRSGNDCGAHD